MTHFEESDRVSTSAQHRPSQFLSEVVVRADGEALVEFRRDSFDSEILRQEIGRITALRVVTPGDYGALLNTLIPQVRGLGYTQVLRRVPATDLQEIWALQTAGFELMDIGLTFARMMHGPVIAAEYNDLTVRVATDADIEQIVNEMVEQPWGSRYEADRAYSPADVKTLRTRWLWNSHRGRAAAVLIGEIEGQPAGYVTCLFDERAGHGEIELVGTLPAFRGRRVAPRLVEHAVAWFSTRASRVTVRTQATNFVAASVYEKSGFTLFSSDLTFRLTVSTSNSVGSL